MEPTKTLSVNFSNLLGFSPGHEETKKLCQELSAAARMGNTQLVQALLHQYKTHPRTYDTTTFQKLVGNALWRSCEQGHLECVKILQPLSLEEDMRQALCGASQNGHNDVFDFLIPFFKEKDPFFVRMLLSKAIEGHSLNILKKVIPYVKSKAHRTEALREACKANNRAAFDLLYPLSNPQSALKYMESRKTVSESEKQMLKDAITAEQQNKVLSEAVGEMGASKRKMKI